MLANRPLQEKHTGANIAHGTVDLQREFKIELFQDSELVQNEEGESMTLPPDVAQEKDKNDMEPSASTSSASSSTPGGPALPSLEGLGEDSEEETPAKRVKLEPKFQI